MSLRFEREFFPKSPSPASSETSVYSDAYATPARYHSLEFVLPRPVQSLPPLRAFLRNEGIDADSGLRHMSSTGTEHEVARESARQRALRAAATRHPRLNPPAGYERCDGSLLNSYPLILPYSEARKAECKKRHWDSDERSSCQPFALSSTPLLSAEKVHSRSLKSHGGPRPTRRLVGSVERMSREDDAPMRPVSAELGVTSDENTSPESSRKRPRPSYLDHSDDEDSNIVGCARSASTTKATTRHQSTEADAEMSDSGSSLTRDEDLEFASRPSKKSSVKPKAGASSDDGLEREYFSPTGVKLEVVELPVKYDTKEWLKHVEQCPDGSKAPWRCTWQTMKNGSPTPCDYSSKKHLVKRHIEATHLCIKRFQCTWCEKTFTQRSNVAGCHLNTHTGAAPHGCDFCDERFKDPSKRHKHMLRCHGYRPGENKKKFKVDDSVQGQSSHESLEPWKVGADRE